MAVDEFIRAANRIEELEASVEKLKDATNAAIDATAHLNAAISLLEKGGKVAAPSDSDVYTDVN